MKVELNGGPLDGERILDVKEAHAFIIAMEHPDVPVYRRSCCVDCALKEEVVVYNFVGYDFQLRKMEASFNASSQELF